MSSSTDSATAVQRLNDSLRTINTTGHPPVDQWHPEHTGMIDIQICSDGSWLHEGIAFQREALVRLFASILWYENGVHYLKTPAEKLSIRVEATPFFITALDIIDPGNDQQQLVFTSSYGDIIVAGANHRLWVEENPETGEPLPYLNIRYGMKGKLSRAVFYQLAEIVQQAPCPPASDEETPSVSDDCLFVYSQGVPFVLGKAS